MHCLNPHIWIWSLFDKTVILSATLFGYFQCTQHSHFAPGQPITIVRFISAVKQISIYCQHLHINTSIYVLGDYLTDSINCINPRTEFTSLLAKRCLWKVWRSGVNERNARDESSLQSHHRVLPLHSVHEKSAYIYGCYPTYKHRTHAHTSRGDINNCWSVNYDCTFARTKSDNQRFTTTPTVQHDRIPSIEILRAI